MEKKLYRDTHNKVIGGVCAGLAEYFNIDVSIVRVIFVASLLLKGGGLLLYLILLIILPKKPYFITPGVDYKVPPFGDAFNQPFGDNFKGPFVEKKKSNGSVIAGSILIVMGAIFLINQFDILPHIYWGRIWPVILVILGLSLIFSPKKREPWKDENWKETAETNKEEAPAEPTETKSTNDNPPTV